MKFTNRTTRKKPFSKYQKQKNMQNTQEKTIQLDEKNFQKIMFIHNAVEKGWSVKKIGDSYIFSKKHENKREVFSKDYLEKFVESNLYLIE